MTRLLLALSLLLTAACTGQETTPCTPQPAAYYETCQLVQTVQGECGDIAPTTIDVGTSAHVYVTPLTGPDVVNATEDTTWQGCGASSTVYYRTAGCQMRAVTDTTWEADGSGATSSLDLAVTCHDSSACRAFYTCRMVRL